MNEDRLRSLFARAIDLPREHRTRFLAEACDDDTVLKEELEALLAADAQEDTVWRRSALHNDVMAERADGSPLGEVVGTYRLVELIGRGGMGAVYRAERVDADFEQCVAVKLIDDTFRSSDSIAQFRSERQILAGLDHPYIARLFDGGSRGDGSPYLIMEYVEGVSALEYCRSKNLAINQRLLLFQQICSAVHCAHQHMVVHRDLKPANILVCADGTPKLLDFGIAKVLRPGLTRNEEALTTPGMLKLTARYASPEQVRGDPVTAASDIYSLGVILYELLTEHSPYGDANRPTHQIMHAVCEEQPSRPSLLRKGLQGDLDNIVLKALRKAPTDRYASADQFSEDILRYLEGRPVLARGEALFYVAAKFVRRNQLVVAVAGLLLCSLIVGLIEVTLARRRADRRFNDVRRLAHSVMFDYADAIERLPGATPVRARLVSDALTYLDDLSKEADTPQLQKEIVDAYVRVSNVQGNEYENNLGDTKGSLASAQKAVSAAERLLKRDRTLPALDSAASAFSTEGSLLYSSGALPSAKTAYKSAIGIRQEIERQFPQDLSNEIALATCLNHMGDLVGGVGFQSLGKTSESLAYYGQAKQLVTQIASRFPNNLDVEKATYETLLSLSASENVEGDHEQAARDLAEAVAHIQRVVALEPLDTNVQVELANAESRRGQLLLDNREAPAAIPEFTRASSLLMQLVRSDPKNPVFQRGLSVVEAQWAAALRGAGQPGAAIVHNQTALALAQALRKTSPDSAQYKSDVGISERKLSEGLLAVGDPGGALHHAEQAIAILCHEEPASTTANTLANCSRSHLAAGNSYLATGNPRAAEGALRKAEEIAAEQSKFDPLSATFRSDTARAQAALASALAQSGDAASATDMYEEALHNWATLRQTKAITAEDSHRSDLAATSLAKLHPRP